MSDSLGIGGRGPVYGTTLLWPVLLATAICMVVIGRSSVTGTLERLGLAICVAWLVLLAGSLTPGQEPIL